MATIGLGRPGARIHAMQQNGEKQDQEDLAICNMVVCKRHETKNSNFFLIYSKNACVKFRD